METPRQSLREKFPGRHDVPTLLGVALLALPFGLLLPTVTLSKVGGISESTFSVVTGILDLARSGNLFLALVIFVFSFLFPIVKLTALWVIWFRKMDSDSRERALHNLKVLGKWSMLDVFVVAVFVGAVQFGFLAKASPRFGLYLFSGAVLLSMVATFLEFRLARVKDDVSRARGVHPSLGSLPMALLAILFLCAGLELPLMEVRKWHFWNREYSVLSATAAMAKDGKVVMAGIVALFVVAIPLITLGGQIALVLVQRSNKRSGKWASFLGHLSRWTMIDVFALGLLIVIVKIGAVADVSPRLGLACFMAGVFFSMSTAWLIKT
jgi:paraquat-inducible protein A